MASFEAKVRAGLPPRIRDLPFGVIIPRAMGGALAQAIALAAKTSVVVLTLKVWGVV